jgi:hypothetical protein
MADNARTYLDLMGLLPEVAEVKARWLYEEGAPTHIDHLVLVGHGGAVLADVAVDDLSEEGGHSGPEMPLADRLPMVATILEWADPSLLRDAGDGFYSLALPSPDHVPDALPDGWAG